MFNPPGQRKCCLHMRRLYDLRVHTYTGCRRTHTEITPAKRFVVRMRNNECSILWVWHRKVGHLTAMIPVRVTFITFKQTQGGVPVYSILLQVICALPLCTVVTFASESQPLNCKPTTNQQRPPNSRLVIMTFYCFCIIVKLHEQIELLHCVRGGGGK